MFCRCGQSINIGVEARSADFMKSFQVDHPLWKGFQVVHPFSAELVCTPIFVHSARHYVSLSKMAKNELC